MGKLDNELLNAQKNEFHSRDNISDLFDDYDYNNWFVPLEEGEKVLPMPPTGLITD